VVQARLVSLTRGELLIQGLQGLEEDVWLDGVVEDGDLGVEEGTCKEEGRMLQEVC
jgi:hypothetical protein